MQQTWNHKYPPPIFLNELFLSNLIHVLVEMFDLHIHLNINPSISYKLLKDYELKSISIELLIFTSNESIIDIDTRTIIYFCIAPGNRASLKWAVVKFFSQFWNCRKRTWPPRISRFSGSHTGETRAILIFLIHKIEGFISFP